MLTPPGSALTCLEKADKLDVYKVKTICKGRQGV